MNLVGRKSKIREKTDLGAWGRRQAQPGDSQNKEYLWGDCLAVSPRSERSGKRPTLEGERGNESVCVCGGGGGGGQIALV